MNTIYESILELERLRREKAQIHERERLYASPLCSDLNRMDALFVRFNGVKTLKTDRRDVFLLIAARIFSPKALAGHNLRGGVRNKLAKVLKCKPTAISHAFENLVFQYKKYRDFREDVDTAFAILCKEFEKD